MIDNNIREYARLINMISLPKKDKDRITEFLIEKCSEKKEISGKYVVAASAIAFIAVGTYLIARNGKHDINVM